jgi:pimeloyl-ACP methyl ester carboxylesterase
MMFRRPTPALITTPLLVLGAECDGSIKPYEVQATAAAYQTEAEFFPDMGHNMMLEVGWQAVAERIGSWLKARNL